MAALWTLLAPPALRTERPFGVAEDSPATRDGRSKYAPRPTKHQARSRRHHRGTTGAASFRCADTKNSRAPRQSGGRRASDWRPHRYRQRRPAHGRRQSTSARSHGRRRRRPRAAVAWTSPAPRSRPPPLARIRAARRGRPWGSKSSVATRPGETSAVPEGTIKRRADPPGAPPNASMAASARERSNLGRRPGRPSRWLRRRKRVS